MEGAILVQVGMGSCQVVTCPCYWPHLGHWFMLYSDIAIKYESLSFKTKPPADLKNDLAAYLPSCDPVELYPASHR